MLIILAEKRECRIYQSSIFLQLLIQNFPLPFSVTADIKWMKPLNDVEKIMSENKLLSTFISIYFCRFIL